jgi:hypothetical protein
LLKGKKANLSEQELKKYRLTGVEEPTDEQLEALMHATFKIVSSFFRIYNKKAIGGSFTAAAYNLRNKF